jgi:hypothetical protein
MNGRTGVYLTNIKQLAGTWAAFSLHALNYETPPSYHDSHVPAAFSFSLISFLFSCTIVLYLPHLPQSSPVGRHTWNLLQ